MYSNAKYGSDALILSEQKLIDCSQSSISVISSVNKRVAICN